MIRPARADPLMPITITIAAATRAIVTSISPTSGSDHAISGDWTGNSPARLIRDKMTQRCESVNVRPTFPEFGGCQRNHEPRGSSRLSTGESSASGKKVTMA